MKYLSGFGNIHSSEAIKGALPKFQNSPQKVPFGLYAEQLSGTAFTVPRKNNRWVWMYRIRPSVLHQPNDYTSQFSANSPTLYLNRNSDRGVTPPVNFRWGPLSTPPRKGAVDFIDGLVTIANNGSSGERGGSVSLYCINASMDSETTSGRKRVFVNNDSEILLIPQQGDLVCKTELGTITVSPLEIAIIPRGMKFQVNLEQSCLLARGYMCENHGSSFVIPDLGPMGASSALANARHFLAPEAAYEENDRSGFEMISKFAGNLWMGELKYSPFDVVAWYGNYAPYKYDLRLFCTVNSVSFDHPDPSIYTVLTSPTDTVGKANIDFVLFPPRWVPMGGTFRPPYFHRNIMSEFMGLIKGAYDAKAGGFKPGGCSLHNSMQPHGPDAASFEDATARDTSMPELYRNTAAFMLESSSVWCPTTFALGTDLLQQDYLQCWSGLSKKFDQKGCSAQRIPLEHIWQSS